MLVRLFKNLLVHKYRSGKFCWMQLITYKNKTAITFALVIVLCVLGSPSVLQSNNSRDFLYVTESGKGNAIKVDDNFADKMIENYQDN